MGGLGSSLGERIVGMRGESLSRRTRAKRYELLLRRFPDLADMRVLDLGGSPHSWQGAPVRPREVVLLNVDWVAGLQSEEIGADAAWMTMVAGDACEPPPEILDERF